MTPAYVSSAVSDVGCRRKLNEDACLARPDIGLWVVADGMGGHQAGDLASRSIVEALDFPRATPNPRSLIQRIEETLIGVNDRLLEEARALGPDAVVASTVVGLVLAETHFVCFWAGDSRAYMIRAGTALQLSRDDSHVQALIEDGTLTEAEARRHPLAHVVTAAVGAAEEFELHLRHGRCAAADRFLLCSDGLSNLVSPGEAGRIAGQQPIAGAAQALVDLARTRGAPDNVTAVVIGQRAAAAQRSTAPRPEAEATRAIRRDPEPDA